MRSQKLVLWKLVCSCCKNKPNHICMAINVVQVIQLFAFRLGFLDKKRKSVGTARKPCVHAYGYRADKSYNKV